MILYVFIASLFQSILAYKPVILIHGVLSDAGHLNDLKNLIQTSHPGTNVTLVKLYPEVESFVPLQHQLEYWLKKVDVIFENSPEGVHLICHSQGGLICQGIIEYCDEHTVHTFIGLSSPLNGQFGVPSLIAHYMPWLNGSRESLTKYMYTTIAQDTFAISNYWRDPRDEYQSKYVSTVRYLPVIQNNPKSRKYNPQEAARHKRNFLKLKKLVLIGGPDDGVITPWQSSLFGFYDDQLNISNMKNQSVFLNDWFGLRTLYERGNVSSYAIRGVKHVDWHGNPLVFHKAIEPWLD